MYAATHIVGVLDTSTAETAVALTFAAKRRVIECVDSAKLGTWGVWQPFQYCGTDIEGSTVGVVGLGRIGEKYARIMKHGFNCRILYTGRTQKDDIAGPLGAKYCSMKELLQESDIVSVHCPLSPSTENLFNLELFKQMQSHAVFINTSRGGVVDQDALYSALVEKKIAGAGLDVTNPEPLPPSHKVHL